MAVAFHLHLNHKCIIVPSLGKKSFWNECTVCKNKLSALQVANSKFVLDTLWRQLQHPRNLLDGYECGVESEKNLFKAVTIFSLFA